MAGADLVAASGAVTLSGGNLVLIVLVALVALAALGFKQILQVAEQVADRGRSAHLAALAARGFLTAGRSTGFGTRGTGGDLGASIALAAATAV